MTLLKKATYKNITFIKTMDVLDEYAPIPAKKNIPDWYKKTDSYMQHKKKPDGKGRTTGTIKKCVPVFDAITAGYIITTFADLFVSRREMETVSGEVKVLPYYEWSSIESIQFHPEEQGKNHPNFQNTPYPKFMSPWGIKTPKGYSCLFIPPCHRETPFSILPGIVDTDNYFAPVNFPFTLSNANFEGFIPAGTPIAQVIPFKRDSWISSMGGIDLIDKVNEINKKVFTYMFDKYKEFWWNRKDFQ